MHTIPFPEPSAKRLARGITFTRSCGRWACVTLTRGRDISRHLLHAPLRTPSRATKHESKHQSRKLQVLWQSDHSLT